MRRSRLTLSILLLALFLPTFAVPAQTPPAEDDAEARLLTLIDELEALLDSLPPERRQAVRRMIEERLTEPPPALEPAPEPTPSATRPTPPPTTPPPPPAPRVVEPTLPPAETPPPTPPTPEPSEPPTPEPAPAPRPALRCELALPLDTDDDGRLTAFDRYWRHLYLWTDVDGDGDLDEREAESPYERGIRSIELGLGSFVRGKGKRKRTLDITIDERVIFDVGGDGHGGPVPRRDDGALVIDASAVRADGGPDLRDADGDPLIGLQALRPGQRWILPDGSELVPRCR